VRTSYRFERRNATNAGVQKLQELQNCLPISDLF
jgi:hypothetical protein